MVTLNGTHLIHYVVHCGHRAMMIYRHYLMLIIMDTDDRKRRRNALVEYEADKKLQLYGNSKDQKFHLIFTESNHYRQHNNNDITHRHTEQHFILFLLSYSFLKKTFSTFNSCEYRTKSQRFEDYNNHLKKVNNRLHLVNSTTKI
jgi:hypothetical protein